MIQTFDSFVNNLRKKNVYILDKDDVDFFKFVSNEIDKGKKMKKILKVFMMIQQMHQSS